MIHSDVTIWDKESEGCPPPSVTTTRQGLFPNIHSWLRVVQMQVAEALKTLAITLSEAVWGLLKGASINLFKSTWGSRDFLNLETFLSCSLHFKTHQRRLCQLFRKDVLNALDVQLEKTWLRLLTISDAHSCWCCPWPAISLSDSWLFG